MKENLRKPHLLIVFLLILLLIPVLAAADDWDPDGIEVTALGTLDPHSIPQWKNQLTGPPPVYVPVSGNQYVVKMKKFRQQVLPTPFNKTTVWGYSGKAKDAVTGKALGTVSNSPGPSFVAKRGTPDTVKWVNKITSPEMFAVDPTIHWANPNNMATPTLPFTPFPPGYAQAQSPVALVTHLHGGETMSASDGGPDQWFTNSGIHGPEYRSVKPTSANAALYKYHNGQQAATLWYHDHALGITRLNVMSGLAGFYLLRDPADPIAPLLPKGKFDMPIVIQDRMFYPNGSFYFTDVGNVPDLHPYWNPEFMGDTIMVNGLVWPNMNVARGTYRFRLLDGSNARFYTLNFSNGMPFTQIASDGGYLKSPVTMTSITIAPGERAEILVDFSSLVPGQKVTLLNSANAPFPFGDPVDPATTGQIMQFTATQKAGPAMPTLPADLNPTLTGSFPNLPAPTNTRIMTLFEVMNMTLGEPEGIFLDGKMWDAPVSELPVQGATEEWKIVDITGDTHPIHLHLVQFQLVSRQAINDTPTTTPYYDDWVALNGQPPFMMETVTPLDPTPYLVGSLTPPAPGEQGWKDTIQMNPGEVTTIRIRWAQQDGNPYPFNPTAGPGYVWHCHILDHEDNEMMRPYQVV